VRYKAILVATARRDFQRIQPRIVSAIIKFAFGDLVDAPRRVGKPFQSEVEGFSGPR